MMETPVVALEKKCKQTKIEFIRVELDLEEELKNGKERLIT